MMIPKDPVMLLSYINTQLRDYYPNLEALGEGLELDVEEVKRKLEGIHYVYSREQNRFM